MKIFKTILLSLSLLYCLDLSAKASAPDTLHVVLENEFLHYPFGVFHNFKEFKNRDTRELRSKVSNVMPYGDGRKEQTKTFSVSSSYARFYLDRNTKKMELVSAIISNKEMPLQNGIMIGMERTDFLKKLDISGNDGTSVIELSSKTGDTHHFYNFQNDKLVRITILTKLFYQKE